MSILQHVFIGLMYLEAIIIGLSLAGCAVGVCLWGWTRWNDRARQRPMDILRMLYGEVGVPYPIVSLIVAAVLGALGMGGLWYLLGRDYDRHQPAMAWADRAKQTSQQKELKSTVVEPEPIPGVKPVPGAESIPRKAKPPITKKDVPIKPKPMIEPTPVAVIACPVVITQRHCHKTIWCNSCPPNFVVHIH